MNLSFEFISGAMFGIEFVWDEDEDINYTVIDILFLRILLWK